MCFKLLDECTWNWKSYRKLGLICKCGSSEFGGDVIFCGCKVYYRQKQQDFAKLLALSTQMFYCQKTVMRE